MKNVKQIILCVLLCAAMFFVGRACGNLGNRNLSGNGNGTANGLQSDPTILTHTTIDTLVVRDTIRAAVPAPTGRRIVRTDTIFVRIPATATNLPTAPQTATATDRTRTDHTPTGRIPADPSTPFDPSPPDSALRSTLQIHRETASATLTAAMHTRIVPINDLPTSALPIASTTVIPLDTVKTAAIPPPTGRPESGTLLPPNAHFASDAPDTPAASPASPASPHSATATNLPTAPQTAPQTAPATGPATNPQTGPQTYPQTNLPVEHSVEQSVEHSVELPVELPIEQKTYETADYRAVVEGFRPRLVEIEIYRNDLRIDRETISTVVMSGTPGDLSSGLSGDLSSGLSSDPISGLLSGTLSSKTPGGILGGILGLTSGGTGTSGTSGTRTKTPFSLFGAPPGTSSGKSRRWGAGIHVGYGITPQGPEPYIGIGIQYNIITW